MPSYLTVAAESSIALLGERTLDKVIVGSGGLWPLLLSLTLTPHFLV